VKELINTVFQGRDLTVPEKKTLFGNKTDQEGLWFLQSNQIESFVQKVAEKYPGFSSFGTNLTPFVNVLARIPRKNPNTPRITDISVITQPRHQFRRKKKIKQGCLRKKEPRYSISHNPQF